MSRKNRFPIVVLLAAALVAGLFALTRTVQLGPAAKPVPTAQVAAKTRSLDQLEKALRLQVAALAKPASASATQGATPSTTLVYVRPAASPAPASHGDDGEEREHESDTPGALGEADGDD